MFRYISNDVLKFEVYFWQNSVHGAEAKGDVNVA